VDGEDLAAGTFADLLILGKQRSVGQGGLRVVYGPKHRRVFQPPIRVASELDDFVSAQKSTSISMCPVNFCRISFSALSFFAAERSRSISESFSVIFDRP
jgi:hypothetical protein